MTIQQHLCERAVPVVLLCDVPHWTSSVSTMLTLGGHTVEYVLYNSISSSKRDNLSGLSTRLRRDPGDGFSTLVPAVLVVPLTTGNQGQMSASMTQVVGRRRKER